MSFLFSSIKNLTVGGTGLGGTGSPAVGATTPTASNTGPIVSCYQGTFQPDVVHSAVRPRTRPPVHSRRTLATFGPFGPRTKFACYYYLFALFSFAVQCGLRVALLHELIL
uniref:Uncharacterized protein n=1 Tax=Anopheles culicifacies TaxID=139723 RepID=A0A182M0X2_9DIPT